MIGPDKYLFLKLQKNSQECDWPRQRLVVKLQKVFIFRNVMGPDEDHPGVDNNGFTNAAAQLAIRCAKPVYIQDLAENARKMDLDPDDIP